MTDLVVLAAGLGRRLAGCSDLPKWLTDVNGDSPAARHLAASEAAGIERVVVVVSDVAGPIAEVVDPWRERLAVELVGNDHATDRNNWYSLLLGLGRWASGPGTDVAVVNSDLFAGAAWFEALLGSVVDPTAPATLAVDRGRPLTDEAMKVAVDARGSISAIGKVGVADPAGEYVGLAWWTRPAAEELEAVLDEFCQDPARADHWYEHGIQVHLDRGGAYRAAPVPSSAWVEIDDPVDLQAARSLADDSRAVPSPSPSRTGPV